MHNLSPASSSSHPSSLRYFSLAYLNFFLIFFIRILLSGPRLAKYFYLSADFKPKISFKNILTLLRMAKYYLRIYLDFSL